MNPIGVIGVGHIGKGFVENLLDAGRDVVVYDVDDSQIEWATDRGADGADSPVVLAAAVDCVVMALPGTPEVETTLVGEDGVLTTTDGLELVIDVTTTAPETSVESEGWCAERGVTFVEAPITGGSPREGMHMMVGGTQTAYERSKEILDLLCADHERIGDAGDAGIFKLGLQVRYAGHHAIDAEVIEFLRDNDVDPAPLRDFLDFELMEQYFSGDFSQEIEGLGGLNIWHKDIGYAHDVGAERDSALPLAGTLHEIYKAAMRLTEADEGHAGAIIRYWQALNGGGEADE